MATIIAKFQFERETKGAVRFQEVVAPNVVPVMYTLYVRKSALSGKIPASITLTLEA